MRERAMFRGSDGTYRDDPNAPLRRAGARGDIGLWAWGRDHYPGLPLQDGVLPGLLSAGLWEVAADQDWGLDWHLNEGVEVTFVTHGRVGFSCGAAEWELGRGWVTVTRPWQRHRVGLPHVTACTLGWFVLEVGALRPNQEWTWPSWLALQDVDRQRLSHLLRGQEQTTWRVSPAVEQAVERLELALRSPGPRTTSRLGLRMSEVLLELLDVLEGDDGVSDPYLTSAERTVEVFLAGLRTRLAEPWTVNAMAAACGLGRTRFTHHCRQLVNTTPLEYLTGLRMERALVLLSTTGSTVTEVALSCGYSSSQYFATVFRQHFDRTPLQARRAAGPTS
ncbi:helix-turn-helix transcriptional regulator [Quadrisphaera sp. INWT6]|uniref:helix-turn-helix transcriptional regulator n=1 Tax=Quadrisphaera sp. INWT6 TaxID=2596917 RepID=UPI001891FC14|nr:helix-turn-helix transcriptional regulator [Quadrisphaera sp. INWT6]MBF5082150.1 helix-turn-helix transcriptional regulator [Quadrisphaera sp. INWT6]